MKPVRRSHISNRNRIVLRPVTPRDRPAGLWKPAGFWYEVDGDWRRWCRKNSQSRLDGYLLHRVELRNCHVLKINTLAKLDIFAHRYGLNRHGWEPIGGYTADWPPEVEIQWARVAQDYDGLEIAPYRRERRFQLGWSWYYGWDCASGVIWEPRNARVTLMRRLGRTRGPL